MGLTATELVERAEAALRKGTKQPALRYAAEYLRLNMHDQGARALVGRALALNGHTREAIAVLRLAARLSLEAGYALQAIAACLDALTLDDGSHELIDMLAQIHTAIQGQTNEGIAQCPPKPQKSGSWTGNQDSLLRSMADAKLAEAAIAIGLQPTKPQVSATTNAVPVFSSLSQKVFMMLAARVQHTRVGPNLDVVQQGDSSRSMFIVVSGSAEIYRDGKRLASLPPGSIVGEMALVSQATRTATIRSKSDLELLEIRPDHIEAIAETYPDLRQTLLQFAGNRMLQNVMAQAPVFAAFAPEERTTLLKRFRPKTVPAGDQIIVQNDPVAGLIVIASGRVRVMRMTPGEPPRTLKELDEGNVVGEISLLAKAKASATVITLTPAVLLILPADEFQDFLGQHPKLAHVLQKMAVDRLQEMQR